MSNLRLNSLLKSNSRMEFQSTGLLYRPEYSDKDGKSNEHVWKLMALYQSIDKEQIQTSIVRHVEYTLCKNRFNFSNQHCYMAVAHSIRDRLIESFNDTQQYMTNEDVKRVYYMSLEFLIGRAMQNSLINLRVEKNYKEALLEIGYQLEQLYEEEVEPALGNGGLGRLAACFLDSLATLNYPAWGYGIRYNYGIFRQKIIDGNQVEVPDYWLQYGNPWEVQRPDVIYPVKFYGKVEKQIIKGKETSVWSGGENVIAEAYDNIIPGFNTFNSINLRLWKSIPTNEFDFNLFNQGDYFKAIETRQRAEYISSVLYPNDSTPSGKELRLKQQYFFVSATLQDIIRRFKKEKRQWKEFPEKAAIQLNDTHPALAIVDLLRILIDQEGLDSDIAFEIVYKTFSYTNHTVLPEALEKWSVDLITHLLPRHMEIIYLINHFWLLKVSQKFPENIEKMQSMSIIEEEPYRQVRMANLSIVGSHTVNGVAQLHTELLKTTLFKDFVEMNPKKFQNKTNGVTPRRWIRCCNPFISELYNKHLKVQDDWVLNCELLKQLSAKMEDKQFHEEWKQMKHNCKVRLAKYVKQHNNIEIDTSSLFDVQIKRIHEYKRQFMNALYVVHRYLQLKQMTQDQRKTTVKRTIFFAGKAAPAYTTAKRIIKLINCISETVNNDEQTNQYLKVIYIANYNVSNAQIIIPASDISQHISTAGLEASGTSNMKFVMNGGIILGTMDGANVEIYDEVGDHNIFIFGARLEQITPLREKMRISTDYIPQHLQNVFNALESGTFGNKSEHTPLLDGIRNYNDHYLVIADFQSYLEAQTKVDQVYQDNFTWTKMSIANAINTTHRFSADRTINQYAQEIWGIHQYPVPTPSKTETERIVGKYKNQSLQVIDKQE